MPPGSTSGRSGVAKRGFSALTLRSLRAHLIPAGTSVSIGSDKIGWPPLSFVETNPFQKPAMVRHGTGPTHPRTLASHGPALLTSRRSGWLSGTGRRLTPENECSSIRRGDDIHRAVLVQVHGY